MIQATVPSGLGLLFTPWRFDAALLISGIATMAAIIYLLILMSAGKFKPRTLAFTAAFYLAFAAALVPVLSRAAPPTARRREASRPPGRPTSRRS